MTTVLFTIADMFAGGGTFVYIVPVIMLAGFCAVGYGIYKEIKSKLKKKDK